MKTEVDLPQNEALEKTVVSGSVIVENKMKKLFKLLEKTSRHQMHSDNLAKEYILFEDGTYHINGYGCFKQNGRYWHVGEKSSTPIQGKYIECYGVSVTNIVYLLEKSDNKVLSISRHEGLFVLFTIDKWNCPKQYYFRESVRLEDFIWSDVFHQLIHLFNIDDV